MSQLVTESILTCPHCGHRKQEVMPADACQVCYECAQCKILLRPKTGDCCVFCSYGSVKCHRYSVTMAAVAERRRGARK